jgi:hypothetical protein
VRTDVAERVDAVDERHVVGRIPVVKEESCRGVVGEKQTAIKQAWT